LENILPSITKGKGLGLKELVKTVVKPSSFGVGDLKTLQEEPFVHRTAITGILEQKNIKNTSLMV